MLFRRRSATPTTAREDIFQTQVRAICTYLDFSLNDAMQRAIQTYDPSKCAELLREHVGSADADVEHLIQSISEANTNLIQKNICIVLKRGASFANCQEKTSNSLNNS